MTLLEDMRQLQHEFDEVEVRAKERVIVARTPHITLKGVPLGPFAVELHLERLSGGRADSSCFDCLALEPNPASGNDAVTHPHVQDRSLCAGDATVPIAAALRQGRLTDAFLLVSSVLHTYNAASPYVALSEWEGVACGDCGHRVSGDDLYYCEACGGDFCGDCYTGCDVCDRSRCRACLELDEESDRNCCSYCRETCSGCDRTVDRESYDAESGLCPVCREQEGEAEPADEPTPSEEDVPDEPPERNEPGGRHVEHERPVGSAEPESDAGRSTAATPHAA